MIETARWGWAVVIGVMGATLSSALGSLLAAPRILMALGQDKLIPLAKLFANRSKAGEPQAALILTGVIVLSSLLVWDLNAIASLLTMFFLITYGTINVAVFIEKAVGSPSFRPSFKVPLIIPLLGGNMVHGDYVFNQPVVCRHCLCGYFDGVHFGDETGT